MNLLPLYSEIDRLRAQLDTLRPMLPEREQKLMHKFRLEWNFNSNHIEGNTLTYGQTELLLIFDKTTGDHEMREYEEMKAHDVAIKMVDELASDTERPLTETFIKKLNEIILVRPFWKEAQTQDGQNTRRLIKVGNYKEQPNHVLLPNGEVFRYAEPQETPARMGDLMAFYKEENASKKQHPLWLAAMMHYEFVLIHPFDDGNGRVARLLMNYVLRSNNYPPVIIKTKDKRNYLNALNKADTGDKDAFVQYIGEQLIWSLNISINAAKGESIDEPEDIDKEIFVLKKELDQKTLLNEIVSNEVISILIEKSIIPLIKEFELKLEKFDQFFLEHEYHYSSKGTKEKYTSFSQVILNLEQIKRADNLLARLYSISYGHYLLGLRSNTKRTVSFYPKIEITFDRYFYRITFSDAGKTTHSFQYGKHLTSEDIENITSEIAKIILNEIRESNN